MHLHGFSMLRTTFRVTLAMVSVALATVSGYAALPAKDAASVRPVAVGAKVPAAARLQTPDGEAVTLGAALAGKPTLLVFYRGSWCPYCNRHLAALADLEPQLLALGYQIVAVSPDTTGGLKKMAEKNRVAYRLFSDRGLEAATALGLAFRVPEATAKNYTDKGVPLAPIPGGDGFGLPVPAALIVDAGGVVRFIHADADIKTRLAPEAVLAAARAAKP